MKNHYQIIQLIGGVISAVTCLIPIINGSNNEYSDLEKILYAVGLTLGSGLILIPYGKNSENKYWFILRPIAILLLFYSSIWIYDNFFDFGNKVKTYHYALGIISITTISLSICLLIKFKRQLQ